MPRSTAKVLDTNIDTLTWEDAVLRISEWGRRRESRYVCACNVHSVVTAGSDIALRDALNSSDMSTPDGMPIAWALKLFGYGAQRRLNGPDLMWRLLAHAEAHDLSVYFYGSSPNTLSQLSARIASRFPRLKVAGALSPPFRVLTEQEDQDIVATINDSGAALVFIGLGCPKQEKWMAAHRGRIRGVMLGVGAAFDYHAGTLKRAPMWMQNSGLEWLYRLGQEPGRLWRRYLVTNSIFVVRFVRQLTTNKLSSSSR